MHRPQRRHYVFAAVFLLVLAFLLTSFRVTVVHGDSMLPSFKNGQMVIVNRLSSLHNRWQRGDVVLIEAGNDLLIKRIRFLPGEVLSPEDAALFLDVSQYFESADQFGTLRVPADRVVILGDNLAVSDDSRRFGPLPLSSVYGYVMNAPPAR